MEEYDFAKHDPAQYESERTADKKLDLKAYQGQHRLLLFFAPAPEHEVYQQQQVALEGHALEMAERDLLTFTLFEAAPSYAGSVEVDSGDAKAIRQTHEISDNEFTVLLIGKDGGVKLRQSHPIEAKALLSLIDSMPMRQQEVAQKQNEG